MANLELIFYVPHRPVVSEEGQVTWQVDDACRPVRNLPQIFWVDGSPWREVNLWALERATMGKTDIKTVQSNLSHLHKYAEWLEKEKIDWKHFPLLERDRVLIRWRKYLIEARDDLGLISPSTASQRMRATIQFYRFAISSAWIGRDSPLWQEKSVFIPFHDFNGFERTIQRLSTDLSIPNRASQGARLEGGVQPLTVNQMRELLHFAALKENCSYEIYLMLQVGFYSGCRIETIADLKRGTLEMASSDSSVAGLIYLQVGPGCSPVVNTKFDVQGRVMLPLWLFKELVYYASSSDRLKREAIAKTDKKDLIFLTRFGNSYYSNDGRSGTAIGRAMVDIRRKAKYAGMAFAEKFHFHMTRATFGTWLTALLLDKGHSADAVLAFVSDAMLHRNLETTMRYIKFIEHSRVKVEVANEFSEAFLGLKTRRGGDDV